MNRLLAPGGVLVLLIGVLWTLQGLGYVGGSAMSGKAVWAIIGPIVGLTGLGLVLLALRRRRRAP